MDNTSTDLIGCCIKAHFHSKKFSTDRKFSENIITFKKLKIFNFKIFSEGKSANHILQNFVSAENFPECMKWALRSNRDNLGHSSKISNSLRMHW